MASFFTNPQNSQYLGTLGLGLLQAAQPQPYGQNRMSYLSNAFARANENLLKSQLMEKRLEELDTRISRYKGLEKERESKQSAVSKLMGGYDPQTDINWETGRAGMSEGEQMSTAAAAAPDQFLKSVFAKPKTTSAMANAQAMGLRPGTKEYNDFIMNSSLKPSKSMYKTKDPNSPTGWSYMGQDGQKIPGAPPPGGQEIVVGADGSLTVRSGPMTGAQAGKRTQGALDNMDRASASIAEVDEALKRVQQNPNAVGVQGQIIESVGGLIEQIPILGGPAGEWLGTEEVQKTRTQLKSLIGRFVSQVTGDESGRYSDRDLQLAKLATQADNPAASPQQVQSALKAIREIAQRDYARSRMTVEGLPDLTSSVGIEEYAGILRDRHPDWNNEQIIDFILKERRRFGVPMEGDY